MANAEQSLFNAQLVYVATPSQLFQSYANLYKAMGGCWSAEAEKLARRQDRDPMASASSDSLPHPTNPQEN